jgi:hypothetical protein
MATARKQSVPEYWLVQGMLLADNTFVRATGFATETTQPTAEDPRSPLQAEVLDDKGKVLLRTGLALSVPCTDSPQTDSPFRRVSGVIAVPKKTARVRFLLGDALLEDYRVPKGEPIVSFTSLPKSGTRGVVRIRWKSEHPAGTSLTHVIGFSADDGKRWRPLGLPTQAKEFEVDLDALPGGEHCRFCVKTTDGIHTTSTISDPIALPIKPCVAMILAPESGTHLKQGTPLKLQGQGYWLEEERGEFATLVWSSSLADGLGHGSNIQVRELQSGTHEITLTAGEGERAGRSSIKVIVD